MSNILEGKLKIEAEKGSYLNNLFGNGEILFGEVSKLLEISSKNYFSLIFGENGVGKTSFLRYLIDYHINNPEDNKLMFITFSVFDEMIMSNSENKDKYIYNGIKATNNSANKKNIYNINKIKIFDFFKKDSEKTLEILKTIYKNDGAIVNDLIVSINILDSIDKKLIELEDDYDLVENINNIFLSTGKYTIGSTSLSVKNLLSLYYTISIFKDIGLSNNQLTLVDFLSYKEKFEKKLCEINKANNHSNLQKFKSSFENFKKYYRFETYSEEEIFEILRNFIIEEKGQFSSFRKYIKNKEGKQIMGSDLHIYFNDFFNELFKEKKEVLGSSFYELLTNSSKIRQKNWGKEVFEYDIGIINSLGTLNLFGNSSSGQLVMLYTYLHLSDFYKYGTKVNDFNKIVIIDEPEISLHPEWQRSYIERLTKGVEILGLTHTFFIITTHSPLILLSGNSDGFNADLYNFFKGEHGLTKSEKIYDINRFSVDELLSKDFGVKIISPNQEKTIKDRYTSLLSKK